ncbi:Uu.00g099010.m01.CDS01 [Anthostomella pinea]|uniref:Uu.00g099010.m01.CDS01 n=1 Tax=Anthostomella pinea TaxID=933095 RepID=A0AAI8VD91_9PEZI|nr:Uu.00g099010.m01.CDS01 [Anthostomella pinea]
METNLEKNAPMRGSRFSWLRTKRAIIGLSLVTCAVIVVIVLAATHVIHGGGSSQDSGSKQQIGAKITSSAGQAVSTSSSASAVSTQSSSLTSSSTPTSSAKTKPTTTSSTSSTASTSSAASTDVPLRIMALGASIVKGETSPGYLGFRKPMRDELVNLGFVVNMVGSIRLGDFTDNDVEAYGGKKITQMQDYATQVVPEAQPNLFLINLGTNNILQNKDVDKAGAQMEDLTNYLLAASNQSTVILSTLLINNVPKKEPMILDINAQYRTIMEGFEADGKPVVLAEMHPDEGVSDVPTLADIGPDGSHPTVAGYEIMGHLFVQAIQEASEKGLIRKAVDNGTPDDGDAERA